MCRVVPLQSLEGQCMQCHVAPSVQVGVSVSFQVGETHCGALSGDAAVISMLTQLIEMSDVRRYDAATVT